MSATNPRALAFVLVALFLFACACGPSEPSAKTVEKPRTPDVTEVKMEAVPLDAGDPTATSPTPSTADAGATTTSSSNDILDDPKIGGPQDAELEKAVAPIRPRLRACYKKARDADPTVGGNATFDATIGKDGKVASARFVKRDGLNEDMMGCLLATVKAMSFDVGKKSQIVTFAFGKAPAPTVATDAGTK